MVRVWHWMATLGRWTAANAAAVLFTSALLTASVGFGLAYLPLGFIVPGMLIVGTMTAWKWRMTMPPRPPAERPTGGEVSD
jgi:hypothetical protein